MGLRDRDHMHLAWSRTSPQGSMRRRTDGIASVLQLGRRPGWMALILGSVLLIALALAGLEQLLHRQTFPASGDVRWFQPPGEDDPTAPLTIEAPSHGASLHMITLEEWHTGQAVAMVPVHRGDSVRLDLPIGRYRVSFAHGSTWLGPQRMFGLMGERRRGSDPLDFVQTRTGVQGHRILLQQLNGNLRTEPVWGL